MDALDAIKKRRAIRKYLDVPPEWEKVTSILDAGRMAPSAGNLQDWKFIILRNVSKRRAMSEACLQQYWMETAPLHIVIVAEPQKQERFYGIRGERFYSIQDCAAVVENMLIAATSVGLASCWVGAFDEEMIIRELGLPGTARPQAIITLGYADEVVPEPPKFKLYDICFFDHWGNRIIDRSLFPLKEKVIPKIKYHLGKIQEKARKRKPRITWEIAGENLEQKEMKGGYR